MDKIPKCCGYEVHEAAALFPLLPESELRELAEDIKARGLINPIVKYGDVILDGRNRLLACDMVGVGPYFKQYEHWRISHTPTEYVLATNSKRRQLTPGQKGAIGTEALPLLEAEAKERRAATLRQNQSSDAEIIPERKNKGESREKAAKALGVNSRYISDAKRIKEKSPKVFEQIRSGQKTIPAAKKELGLEPPAPEPDHPAILREAWLKCTQQQQTDFLRWSRKNRK